MALKAVLSPGFLRPGGRPPPPIHSLKKHKFVSLFFCAGQRCRIGGAVLKNLMSKTITKIDEASSVSLPPEAIDALGVGAGGELDIEIVGRALVVRSVEEAQRSREFDTIFESVLQRRQHAYK